MNGKEIYCLKKKRKQVTASRILKIDSDFPEPCNIDCSCFNLISMKCKKNNFIHCNFLFSYLSSIIYRDVYSNVFTWLDVKLCLLISRFFLYVFLAAIAVLLLVGAQQVLASFGVSVNHTFWGIFFFILKMYLYIYNLTDGKMCEFIGGLSNLS